MCRRLIVDKLSILLISAAAIILGGSIAIFLIESPHPDSQITTLLDAVWWTVSTVTTVGYGDVVPVTVAGKIMAIFFMLSGITILGVFLSVLGTRFYKRRFEKDEKEFSSAQKQFFDRMDVIENNQKNIQKEIRDLVDQIKQNKN